MQKMESIRGHHITCCLSHIANSSSKRKYPTNHILMTCCSDIIILAILLFPLLKRMFSQLFISSSKLQCEPCEFVKHYQSIDPISGNGNLLSFSICAFWCAKGNHVMSLVRYHYFVTFVDDFSKTKWVYLLKCKSDVFPAFKSFDKMVEPQFQAKLQILRSNNGGAHMMQHRL